MICGHCKTRETIVEHVRSHSYVEIAADIKALTGYDSSLPTLTVDQAVAQMRANEAKTLAQVTGSVAATVIHSHRDSATGELITDSTTTLSRVTEKGIYILGKHKGQPSRFYLVVATKDGERLYAKEALEDGSWDYEKGAIYNLYAEDRATVEEVAERGRLTGSCCVCARRLTDPNSVNAGIGPICARRV